MSEAKIFPTPVLDMPKPPDDKWQREKLAFYQMRDQLLTTHRGKFVAIHEGKLVDSDTDKIALGLRVYQNYGYVPIFVTLVTDQPSPPIRLPSPRPRDMGYNETEPRPISCEERPLCLQDP